MDWFDLLAVQGTLKSLLQHHNSKAAILQCSAEGQSGWEEVGSGSGLYLRGQVCEWRVCWDEKEWAESRGKGMGKAVKFGAIS